MTAPLRFEGRTAIVTGAGGNPSLGRAYALLLAERGANVVVNDIGRVPEVPMYDGEVSAEAVAEEIRSAGGNAVADTHSVASEDGASAIVATALSRFGTVDILVNNAALCILAPFGEMTAAHYRSIVDTNLMGPVWLSRAAWPHMVSRGYGRIVNVGAAVFGGTRLMSAYGTSKGGLFLLSQTLAVEGRAHGIKANTVQPTGFSRMVPALQKAESSLFGHLRDNFPPELTAPIVGLLAHEKCPVSGECFDSAGGRVSRMFVAQNRGHLDREHTVESLLAHWDEVADTASAELKLASEFDADTWHVRPYSEYAHR